MATVDLSTSSLDAQPYPYTQPVSLVTLTVDAATNTATTSDDYKLGDFPTTAMVLCGWLEVVTPEGGTATVDIGIAQDGATIVAGADVNAAAGTITAISLAAPVAITSGNIWVEPQNNLDAAEFKIHLVVAYPSF